MLDNRFEDKDRLDREAFATVQAFGDMAARYYNRVYFTALAVVREREMAEDIAQETFFRVWMTRENARGKTVALQPWLTAIARNLAVDWQRKGQQRSRVMQLISMEDLPVEPVSNKSESPREAAASAEAWSQVNQALETMPDDLRQVIFLHYGEEMSASDIARMNGEAVSTVTRRLEKARQMVREQIESGLAAGIAVLKPNRRAVERLLAAVAGAGALSGTAQAELAKLLQDTPAPVLVGSGAAGGTGAVSAAAKVTGGMTLGKWMAAAGIAVVCVGGAALVNRWSSTEPGEVVRATEKTRIVALDGGADDRNRTTRLVAKRSERGGAETTAREGTGAVAAAGVAPASSPVKAEDAVAGYVTVRGVVCDEETSEPLPKAEVYGIAPGKDMRQMRRGEDAKKRVRVVADDQGRYEIRLPMTSGANTFSLDAFSPGYRSLAGTYTSGGDFSKHGVTAKAGDELELTLALPKALYVAGRVVDEEGNGIAGVKVQGTIEYINDKGMAYIANEESDKDGWFEVYDYMVNAWYETYTPGKPLLFSGKLEFKLDDRLTTSIGDIYPLDPEVRTNLTVVMPQGEVISGQVVDAAGRPGAGLPLYIETGNVRDRSRYERRDVKTDDGGFFSLKGLPEGEARICVRDMKLDEWESTTVTVPVRGDLTLRMHATPYADTSKAVELLGMKLADVTPELKGKYDLWSTTGVVVLEAGTGAARIDTESKDVVIAEGDHFFFVGDKRISSLREFAEEMLKVNALPKPEGFVDEGYEGYVRVAYNVQASRGWGSRTQYMKLSPDDVRELREYLERAESENIPR